MCGHADEALAQRQVLMPDPRVFQHGGDRREIALPFTAEPVEEFTLARVADQRREVAHRRGRGLCLL